MDAEAMETANLASSSEKIEISVSHNLGLHEELEAFRNDLISLTSNVKITIRQGSGFYGALEWLIPAAVAIYIGRAFIDSFFKELGSGAATGLRNGLLSLFRKIKEKNLRIVSKQDLEKLNRARDVTSATEMIGKPTTPISITIEFVETRIILILPSDLDDSLFQTAIRELVSIGPIFFDMDKSRQKLLEIWMALNEAEPARASAMYESEDFPREKQIRYVFDVNSLSWVEFNALLKTLVPRSKPGIES